MNGELRVLRKHSMQRFFKDQPFITKKDFEENYAEIMEITSTLRKVKDRLNKCN